MLALSSSAGHSGRSLTTTYETIPYLLHYSPRRRWLLDVVMRQQEGIDDDDQHEQLGDSEDHQEEVDRPGHEEVDHEEVFDQEEDGNRGVAICFSVSYSINCQVRGTRPPSPTYGEGAPDRWSPSLNLASLVPEMGMRR